MQRLFSCAAREDSNCAARALKKNAVQWLLFFLSAAASLLDRRCRLRRNVGLCLTRGMEEDWGPLRGL